MPATDANHPRFSGSRFREVVGSDGRDTKVLACYEALHRAYTHPHRHYHAVWHIDECLGLFDEYRALAREPRALELAIWFHDFVYRPGAADNETVSAALAVAWLRHLGEDDRLLRTVDRMIRCTAEHLVTPDDPPDAALLVDIDLASLAANPEVFARNSELVRREFAHVPDAAFGSGRANALARFAQRTPLYLTPALRERFEARARANLARVLAGQ